MHEIDQELILKGDMVLDEPNQDLIDELSVGVLDGRIDCYDAKRVVEHDDWDLARWLIQEARRHAA